MSALPLAPLVGNMWVPVWAVRPGSYSAPADVAATMPLLGASALRRRLVNIMTAVGDPGGAS